MKAEYGIVCLTRANYSAPWLNFEAGALSNALGNDPRRVAPLLFALSPGDVTGPITQFQMLDPSQENMRAILLSVNEKLRMPLSEARIDKAFNAWWPELKTVFDAVVIELEQEDVPSTEPSVDSERQLSDKIDEVLAHLRAGERAQERDERQKWDRSFHRVAGKLAAELPEIALTITSYVPSATGLMIRTNGRLTDDQQAQLQSYFAREYGGKFLGTMNLADQASDDGKPLYWHRAP